MGSGCSEAGAAISRVVSGSASWAVSGRRQGGGGRSGWYDRYTILSGGTSYSGGIADPPRRQLPSQAPAGEAKSRFLLQAEVVGWRPAEVAGVSQRAEDLIQPWRNNYQQTSSSITPHTMSSFLIPEVGSLFCASSRSVKRHLNMIKVLCMLNQ